VKLTERQLRATYTYLCQVPPFNKWKLPDEYRIDFRVNNATMTCGMYEPDPHTITVSRLNNVSHTDVLKTMAHEVVHLQLERTGKAGHEDHNEEFLQVAREVCESMNWPVESF
jgi:hypothetical protein